MTPLGRHAARVTSVALALLALLSPSPGRAHGLEPALLALREGRAGEFEVTWKSAKQRLPGADLRPLLPAHCRQSSPAEALDEGDRVRLRWTVDCGSRGLVRQSIGVADLDVAKITALVLVETRDGVTVRGVLGARDPSLVVPARAGRWDVLRSYAALGIEHILTGPDHLLFVLGLLLLASTRRRLAATVTAFTLGHSITLSLAVLDLARVPSRPIEVLIALSVLALAVELARPDERATLLGRSPWAMALVFGLLHGFGFAGALAEAGLPAGEVPLALFSFNLGIELGQLAFVALAWSLADLARRTERFTAGSRRVAVYAMGILAAFWCFERIALWLA